MRDGVKVPLLEEGVFYSAYAVAGEGVPRGAGYEGGSGLALVGCAAVDAGHGFGGIVGIMVGN